MALALVVDSLDSIPEPLRAEYAEKDGKFFLNVDGLDDHPATAGMRTTMVKERDARKAAEKELAAFKKTGRTAAEIEEFVAAQEAAAAEAAKKAGNFDAILKQHQDKWSAEKATIEKRLEGANTAARSAIVDASVTTALTKSKATQEGLDLLTERLGKRVHLEIGEDGKRKIQIMQADGETPMAGKGADGAATFDDLVAEAVKTWPSLFEGSGAGGSGAPNKGGKPGDKTISRADWEKLTPVDRQAKHKAGIKVVD